MNRIVFLLVMSCASVCCYGQFDVNKAFEALTKAKSETLIIETAVKQELSVIRQQYRLSRNGETFGKNHKTYYGESYSLGIKVSNGLIISNTVVTPWVKDADFNRLNASGQYQPELFWTYQKGLEDSEYKKIDLEFGTDYIHPLDTLQSLYVHEEVKGDFGLTIDDTPGEKQGYMIWARTDSSLQDSLMTVSTILEPMNVVASGDSARISLAVDNPDKVLGGLFVVPRYERGGRIQLQLVAVATPDEIDGKWSLYLFTKRDAASGSAVDEVGSNNSEPTLIESQEKAPEKKQKKKNR